MEEKQKKMLGYVFAGIVLVGLVLVIVGMCIGAVTESFMGISVSIGLFDELWSVPGATVSPTFTIIAFIVAIVGAVVLLVDAILRVFVGKNLKIVRIIGAAVTLIGAVLVLVAGLMLVSDLGGSDVGLSAGAGIWLGFIGGLVATVGGALPLLKAFN